ncbi:putative zinc-binding protein [Anaeroselena agilis]|uniref:Zinc-binding protein n=1 Tax=Anaeroselena agilis TaxID=3063788 RepID=A0ABU3NY66_9FIRM|nr:putative zinc-binding protein [Selenomonadales bacterium 4137-cl]
MSTCSCQAPASSTRIAYACAGCADVGAVADSISRKLRQDGFATPKASCLAGIGAGLQPFIDAAKAAGTVITIDGCETACARKMIENIGLTPEAVILTQMGLEKGKTTPTPDLCDNLCKAIATRFAAP